MTERSREENVGKPLKMVCENVRMFAAHVVFHQGVLTLRESSYNQVDN